MNHSTAIFLVNPDVRAVWVSYEVDKDGKGVSPFTPFKSLDHTLAKGNYVVVPTNTRHSQTVCRVEEVEIDFPLDYSALVQWVVQKVDWAAYSSIVEMELAAIEKIKSAEKRRAREELASKLRADNPDLDVLASIGESPMLVSPPGS